jgi:hypothetical protein
MYESLSTVLSGWARNHVCEISGNLTGVVTPYDGGDDDIRCEEYKECQNGRVMQCFHDGRHGSWVDNLEELSWWFFSQYLPTDSITE